MNTSSLLYSKSFEIEDWRRGNDELGSAVEQQPVGKLIQQSCGEVQRATFSQLTQPKPKPICDRSGETCKHRRCLLLKVKRPVPTRSMKKVCKKNLVLQIDRGNLRNCLKTPVLSKLTMDQDNLMSETAQVHTQ